MFRLTHLLADLRMAEKGFGRVEDVFLAALQPDGTLYVSG